MIVVIDFRMGNVGSILNMLKKIGVDAILSKKHNDIKRADKIILPGVGAFDNGMCNLNKYQLIEVLNEFKQSGKKILGICLGMQMMAISSEEGSLSGLGWIDAQVKKFSFEDNSLKIPHMGWNIVEPYNNNPFFKTLSDEIRVYFVHSYYVCCNDEVDIMAKTTYGIEFVSAFQHENVYGMQFHPEKSHKFGMDLLKKFVEL